MPRQIFSEDAESNNLKFYVLALYAVNRNPLMPEVSATLGALGAVAASDEEAQQLGMARLLDSCPLNEGWTSHYVTASVIKRVELLKAAKDATYCGDDSNSSGHAQHSDVGIQEDSGLLM